MLTVEGPDSLGLRFQHHTSGLKWCTQPQGTQIIRHRFIAPSRVATELIIDLQNIPRLLAAEFTRTQQALHVEVPRRILRR